MNLYYTILQFGDIFAESVDDSYETATYDLHVSLSVYRDKEVLQTNFSPSADNEIINFNRISRRISLKKHSISSCTIKNKWKQREESSINGKDKRKSL